MIAAERGAAANTIAAYRRDLDGAEDLIGPLAAADREALTSLGGHWSGLAPSSLARKCSALRQFYGFLVDDGLRVDDPSSALPRPRARRPLPRLLDHAEVDALFVRAEEEAAGDRPEALRMLHANLAVNPQFKQIEVHPIALFQPGEGNRTRQPSWVRCVRVQSRGITASTAGFSRNAVR